MLRTEAYLFHVVSEDQFLMLLASMSSRANSFLNKAIETNNDRVVSNLLLLSGSWCFHYQNDSRTWPSFIDN